jgi:hypothetical protein
MKWKKWERDIQTFIQFNVVFLTVYVFNCCCCFCCYPSSMVHVKHETLISQLPEFVMWKREKEAEKIEIPLFNLINLIFIAFAKLPNFLFYFPSFTLYNIFPVFYWLQLQHFEACFCCFTRYSFFLFSFSLVVVDFVLTRFSLSLSLF